MALTAEKQKELEELQAELGLVAPTVADPVTSSQRSEEIASLQSELGVRPPQPAPGEPTKEEREQLREGVTLPRALKHGLTGIPSGLGDTINLPKTMTDLARGGTEWVANKLPGVDNFELPSQALPAGMPGAFLFNEQPYSTTDLLKKLPGGSAVGDYVAPELTPQEIKASDLGGVADLGRTFGEWFQPASVLAKGDKLLKMKPDAIMAALAAFGKYVGDETGELIGGGLGILQALRTGDFSKLTKADQEAVDFVIASSEHGDNLAGDVATRVAAGEEGTLADLGRDRGVYNVQKTMESVDQDYKNIIADKGRVRNAQIADEVTIPFRRDEKGGTVVPLRPVIDEGGVPTTDPSLDAARADVEQRRAVIEQALDEDVADINAQALADQERISGQVQEVSARELPTADPDIFIAHQKAKAAQMKADEVVFAQDAADAAQGKLVPLRADNARSGTPPSRTDEIFEGVDMENPEAMQRAQDSYWSEDAFSEVKDRAEKFTLDAEVLDDVRGVLDVPEVRTELGGYLDEVAERARRARKIPYPNRFDEDFNKGEYIESVLTGEISGRELMALRNWFASRAASATESGAKMANTGVKNRLERVITDQLDEAGKIAFNEQMAAYPGYLANQRLMDQVSTVAEYGEYLPKAQLSAGKPFGYPNLEPNRALNRELNETAEGLTQATAAEKKAASEAARADSAAGRAEKGVVDAEKAQAVEVVRLEREAAKVEKAEAVKTKQAETASGREQIGLDQSLVGEYAANPQKALKKWVSDPDGGETLGRVYESMTDLGQRENFRMEIGRALASSIGASGSTKILKKSADDFANLRKTLHDSGILDGDGINDITAALEKTVTDQLAAETAQKLTPMGDSEVAKVTSSILAALAVNATPVTGGSLILAGTFKRAMVKAVRSFAKREDVTESLIKITSDPKYFLELVENAKSEKEAIKLFFTPIVGAAQAQRIADEETE